MVGHDRGPRSGQAATADRSAFAKITPQKPPNHPRIKALLGRALKEPATLAPEEVREMAASLVYHLLSQGQT